MRGISSVTEDRLSSQEDLCFTELVRLRSGSKYNSVSGLAGMKKITKILCQYRLPRLDLTA